jgi:hypothetical protein
MAELPEQLREAAAAHHPDRERMLARIERATAGRGHGPERWRWRPGASWMRVTAVAAAVAGAIGLGGLAVGAVTGEGEPAGTSVTSGGSGTVRPAPFGSGATATGPGAKPRRTSSPGHLPAGPGRTPGPTTTPPPPSPSHTAVTTPPAAATTAPATGTPGAPGADSGVSCTGALGAKSSAYWTESDLTLTTERALTSLTVELRVARTAGVESTGSYSSVPGQTAPSVTVEGDDLVYRWTLNEGQTLSRGTYTFAGQFNHGPGDRDTGGDHFAATGNGPGGPAVAEGGF